MVQSANTTKDISEIKESLGQEVVPSVTGKPSRILKNQRPKHSPKKVTAAGASLFEIAAAIKSDPTITVEQAITQGKQESKEHDSVLRKGVKSFFLGALGHGLGNAVAGIFDTKIQKEEKKLAEVERKYEEGNKFKANLLKSLLGEKVGGLIARASTLTSTKTSAFEKYQELIKPYYPIEKKPVVKKTTKKAIVTKKLANNLPKIIKSKSTPEREEAHKALMALGYKKEEANERLANAPENASVEELIRHGLNPTVKSVSRPEAVSAIQSQLMKKQDRESTQQEAEKTRKEEDTKLVIKEQQEHNKKVEDYLKEILKRLNDKSSNSLFGSLLGALAKALSKTFGKIWTFLTKLGEKFAKLMPRILKALGSIGRGIVQIGGKSLKWLSNALEGLGLSDIIAAGGAAAITGAAVYGSQKLINKTLRDARTQLDEPLKKYGLETDHQHYGYFKLNGREISADDLPEIYKNLVYSQYTPQQMSIGKINEAKQYLQTHQAELKAIEVKPIISAPTKVTSKASKITPKNVADISQNHVITKKENDDLDFMSTFQEMLLQMGIPNSTDVATLQGVNDIKSVLPALAKKENDPGGVVVKLRNSETSQATYVAQIFEHPAVYNGLGTM